MMLLTLPIAAPALIPSSGETRWDGAPPLTVTAAAGDSLKSIAGRGLTSMEDLKLFAEANGLAPDAVLRAGQKVEVPGALLKREMLAARVSGFSGYPMLQGGEPLAVGLKLSEGDIIETGPNGFVSLLAAGQRVTLPSASRVKIVALHRVALNGAVVRTFALLPLRDDWLASLGLRGGESTLAMAELSDAGATTAFE